MNKFSKASEKLADARILLLTHEPWYGHAAMMFDWIESSSIDTIGVRIRNTLTVECLFNPLFIAELNLLETCSVIKHEVEHIVRCHCVRVGDRDPMAWNIAADMVVNGHRSNPRIGFQVDKSSPPVIPLNGDIIWTPEEWSADCATEWYYEWIERKSLVFPAEVGQLDDHSRWNEGDINQQAAEAVAGELARYATEKNSGSTPGHLRNVLSKLGQSRVPWQDLFRKLVSRQLSHHRKPSFSRRHRRRDEFGIPGYKRLPNKLHVSVVVDVSGSIGRTELQSFFAEIERMKNQSVIDVLQWDCRFQGIHRNYRPGQWQNIEICGGGGTDMAAPVCWLKENSPKTNCIVIFTDGYCNWPTKPLAIPLIAVLTTNMDAPSWVTAIRIN